MPDGRIGRFEVPEGTTPEQAIALATGGGSAHPPQQQGGFLRNAGITARGVMNGVTDLWDTVSNSGAAFPMFTTVAKSLGFDPSREVDKAPLPRPETNREKLLAATARGAVAGAPLGAGGGAGGILNAITSGASSSAAGEFARQKGAGPWTQAAASLAGGMAAGYAPRKIAKVATPSVRVPTEAELRLQADAAYTAARNSGVTFHPSEIQNLNRGVVQDLSGHPNVQYHPNLHPRIKVALDTLDDLAGSNQPPSFQQLELARRVAKTAGRSLDADERRLSRMIVGRIDDFVKNAGPTQGTGNTAQAAAAIAKARSNWSRMAKSEQINEMISKAQNSASSPATALQSQFRSLANNPARMRQFTPQEQAAITQMAKGTWTQKTLQAVGVLAPGKSLRGAIASLGGIGLATQSLPLAGTLMLGGFGAKQLANVTARSRANNIAAMMRNGAPVSAQTSVALADLLPYVPPAAAEAARRVNQK